MSRLADQFIQPASGMDLPRFLANGRIDDPALCGSSSSPVAGLVRADVLKSLD